MAASPGPAHPSLSPPPHHGSLLPGARLPLALDLDTLALAPASLHSASGLVEALSAPTHPSSWHLPSLHSKRPPMCLVLLSEDPCVLGTGRHPLPSQACRSLWGRGDRWTAGCVIYSGNVVPGWQRGESHGVGVAVSLSCHQGRVAGTAPQGGVSVSSLGLGEPLLAPASWELRPGGQGGEGHLLRRGTLPPPAGALGLEKLRPQRPHCSRLASCRAETGP